MHAAGACASLIRTYEEWDGSEQGQLINKMPLLSITRLDNSAPEALKDGPRPLSGIVPWT